MVKRVYTKDEADAILARAFELQGVSGTTTHDDLIAAGTEVGLSRDAIDRAADEMESKRRDDEALREVRARSWRGFYAHFVPYALVNLLLAFVNVMTGGPPWMLVVTLGWGVGLGSHLLAVANPDPSVLRRRVERVRRGASGALGVTGAGDRLTASHGRPRIAADAVGDEGGDRAEAAPPVRGMR
ncbi:MAG: 2TM domain-containing protein [Polyangiaceae bacterium]|nr:2TM domain-containing protein [Polyangiaceae bacterium]